MRTAAIVHPTPAHPRQLLYATARAWRHGTSLRRCRSTNRSTAFPWQVLETAGGAGCDSNPRRGHARRHLHEKVPRLTGSSCRRGGRPSRETPPPAAHISHVADDPGTGIGSPWNQDRPRTPAPARDTMRPARARARSVAVGRSVMKRTRIRRPGVRSERPWLEALAPDPRDPDIVRAKALARTGVPSSTRPGLHTKVRCRHG
jgi:hypothetical protein